MASWYCIFKTFYLYYTFSSILCDSWIVRFIGILLLIFSLYLETILFLDPPVAVRFWPTYCSTMETSLLSHEMKNSDFVPVLRYLLVIVTIICGTVLIHDGLTRTGPTSPSKEVHVGGGIFTLLFFLWLTPVLLLMTRKRLCHLKPATVEITKTCRFKLPKQ